MKTYTLDQIKKAFWTEFHESGELWFDYLGTKEENEQVTNSHWQTFFEALESKVKNS